MLHQAFGETALNQQKTFDWKMPSSPWSKKVKQIWSKISPMLITFTIRRTFLECLGGAVHWTASQMALRVPAFCTSTMCHAQWPWMWWNSWPSMAFQWFPTCLTHHIGHPVTFSSAPGWRSPWRENGARYHGNTTQYIWQLHWEVEELLQSRRTIGQILLQRR